MTFTWNKIAKATSTTWTVIPKAQDTVVSGFTGGQPIGLLLALTQSQVSQVTISPWTKVNKATSTTWTVIPKAT